MERVKGIEPSYAAWEASVLPLNYTRVIASHFTVTEEQIEVITVFINGAARQLPEHSSIAALIDELGYTGKRIALERNGDIVPRSLYAEKTLTEGDKLEIVVAVGGG